jgi:hypothetical protein
VSERGACGEAAAGWWVLARRRVQIMYPPTDKVQIPQERAAPGQGIQTSVRNPAERRGRLGTRKRAAQSRMPGTAEVI